MILCTACPVFQTKTVFDCKDDLSVRLEMPGNDLQKIHIRCITLDISLSILKHANKCDIIIFFCEILLNILEISHENLEIIKSLMSVGIDQTSFV